MMSRKLTITEELFKTSGQSDDDAQRVTRLIRDSEAHVTKESLEEEAHALYLLTDYGFWYLAPLLVSSLQEWVANGTGSLLADTALDLFEWSYNDDVNQELERRVRLFAESERSEIHAALAEAFDMLRSEEPYHFEAETLSAWSGIGVTTSNATENVDEC